MIRDFLILSFFLLIAKIMISKDISKDELCIL